MCGQCLECVAINVAEVESEGKIYNFKGTPKDRIEITMYLQETSGFLSGLEYTEQYFSFDNYAEYLQSEVILCRTLECLHSYGFDSSTYQALIGNDIIKWAIEKECDTKTNNDITFFMDGEIIKELYVAGTYLDKNTYLSFCEKYQGYDQLYRSILQQYSDWWLYGENLKLKGEWNPWSSYPDEWNKFYLSYRSLFFSLLQLDTKGEKMESLMPLIIKDSEVTPRFDGLDLWLQRRAICKFVSSKGAKSLLAHIANIRPQLIYYVAVKMRLNKKDRRLLSDSMLKTLKPHPKSDTFEYAKSLISY